MEIDHSVWLYNWIPNTHNLLAPNEVWYCSIFDPVSDTLWNYHVWRCPTYVLEPKIQKSGVNIPKWYPRIWQVVDVGFIQMDSTVAKFILNTMAGSISPQVNVVSDGLLTIIQRNGELEEPRKRVKLITSPNVYLQVILDQEGKMVLYEEWQRIKEWIVSEREAINQLVQEEGQAIPIFPTVQMWIGILWERRNTKGISGYYPGDWFQTTLYTRVLVNITK